MLRRLGVVPEHIPRPRLLESAGATVEAPGRPSVSRGLAALGMMLAGVPLDQAA